MKQLLIAILLITPAFATERNKRDFRPITPLAIVKAGKYLKLNKETDSQERGSVVMPKKEPERIYDGPENSLFPTPDLNFDEIKD